MRRVAVRKWFQRGVAARDLSTELFLVTYCVPTFGTNTDSSIAIYGDMK